MKKFQGGSRFEPKDRVFEKSRNLHTVGMRILAPRMKTKPKPVKPQGPSFGDLLAKAQKKLEEKRQTNHREVEVDITSQRIASRLALNQTFNDHLDYHSELEQLGCKFIHDQVKCLEKFKLRSRSDYFDKSNSILRKYENPWSDEYSTRKNQKRSTTDQMTD